MEDNNETFTIQEIRNYLLKQDSMGDILYYLSADNIKKVNELEIKDDLDIDMLNLKS